MKILPELYGLLADRLGHKLTVLALLLATVSIGLLGIQVLYLTLHAWGALPSPDWAVSRVPRAWMEALVATLF